jgi:hypothetical protein
MEPNWATENLQVIRTLMERATIYRRALAPIMLTAGLLGIAGGIAGWLLHFDSPRSFALFWSVICMVGIAAAFMLVRRQALKAAEPFWSPPTRRVTQAVLPSFFAGLFTVAALFLPRWSDPLQAWWPPLLWMIFYGCALHAAGFFMPRGIKLFAWIFILTGGALFLVLSGLSNVLPLHYAHGVMGIIFGGLHLAYGLYLYATGEKSAPSPLEIH